MLHFCENTTIEMPYESSRAVDCIADDVTDENATNQTRTVNNAQSGQLHVKCINCAFQLIEITKMPTESNAGSVI
jgi:uncharacterized protein YbaA (DUF1428 family)